MIQNKQKKLVRPASTAQLALRDRIKRGRRGAESLNQGFGRFNWLERKKGRNRIRIILPPKGPFSIAYKEHSGKIQGKYGTAINYDWLLTSRKNKEDESIRQEMVDALQSRGVLSDSDINLWQEYGGDPFNILYRALEHMGKEKMFTGISKQRVLFVAVKPDLVSDEDPEHEVCIFAAPPGNFADPFFELCDEDPDIVLINGGTDIRFKGTGDGFGGSNSRKYTPPTLTGDPYDLNIDDSVIPNLYDVFAGKWKSWEDKVKFMFESWPKLIKNAELELEDLGVEPKDDD